MKKIIFFILFLPFTIYSQWTQIGQDIVGEENMFGIGGTVKLNAIGDVIAFGSFYESCKCVYVYENVNDSWVQKGQTIFLEDGVSQVTLNETGDVLVFDTFGFNQNLFLYYFNGSEWVTYGDFSNLDFPLKTDGYYPIDINHNGDIVSFGTYEKVFVIKNNNGIWEQIGQTIEGDGVGSFVRLSSDGQTLFTTAYKSKGKVFKLTNNTWEQIGSGIIGASIQITAADISSDGSTLLIKNTNNNKAILRFNQNSNDWELIYELFSPAPYGNLNSSGDIFITTSKVYQNQNGNYTQLGQDLDIGVEGGFIETSINDMGDIVAIGSELYDEGKGLVRVFRYDGDLSVFSINTDYNITVYPNPVRDILYFSDFVQDFMIYDLTGKIVKSSKELTNQVNLSNLANGTYIIKGNMKSQKSFSIKIIKAN